MKAHFLGSFTGNTAVLVLAATVTASSASAQLAPSSSLIISPGKGGSVASIKITAPGDQVWVIQSSSDLVNWSDTSAWKVHNGSFQAQLDATSHTPAQFFRAVFDPARQDILSTVENALHLPVSPFNYAAPTLPPQFLVPPIVNQDNTPATNLTTDAGAALGRVLFYDKRLSANQTISCASCHQAIHAFADPRPFSPGLNGGLTGRNTMGLSNARYYLRRHFFWDERADTLENQVLQPIQNSVEMGMTLPGLVSRLQLEPFYTNLFARAFGTPEPTVDRVARALAQFVRSILSTQSKYDQGVPIGFSNFTPQENLGRQLFLGQVGRATCVACHGTDNFVPGPNINNNGLETPYVDRGLGGVTGRPQDDGLFKVPSLRNIELTAPYMHDGRFTTLEEVVEFYNSGVVDGPNLSPPLRVPPGPGRPAGPLRLNLTPNEKAALVAFLKTLTDPTVASNPKYSDPFNYGN